MGRKSGAMMRKSGAGAPTRNLGARGGSGRVRPPCRRSVVPLCFEDCTWIRPKRAAGRTSSTLNRLDFQQLTASHAFTLSGDVDSSQAPAEPDGGGSGIHPPRRPSEDRLGRPDREMPESREDSQGTRRAPRLSPAHLPGARGPTEASKTAGRPAVFLFWATISPTLFFYPPAGPAGYPGTDPRPGSPPSIGARLPWSLLERLEKGALVGDGAMGTMLYAKGIFINRCFDELNFTSPEVVREVHQAYVDAGAEFVETNSFGANHFKLEPHGLSDKVAEINRAAAEIARGGGAGRTVLVAGSIGPLGVVIEPLGKIAFEEARECFREQAEALEPRAGSTSSRSRRSAAWRRCGRRSVACARCRRPSHRGDDGDLRRRGVGPGGLAREDRAIARGVGARGRSASTAPSDRSRCSRPWSG